MKQLDIPTMQAMLDLLAEIQRAKDAGEHVRAQELDDTLILRFFDPFDLPEEAMMQLPEAFWDMYDEALQRSIVWTEEDDAMVDRIMARLKADPRWPGLRGT